MMTPASSKPARDMTVVGFFALLLALSACSFSTWWYMHYRIVGGAPAVTLPAERQAAIDSYNFNFQTRFLKKYTIYGTRRETLRTVFQNNARTAEGECQTVTTQLLWSREQFTRCIFEFNHYSGFDNADEAEANMEAWCDRRCADVKAMRKTTCDSVAYDISSTPGGVSGTVAGGNGGGLAEAEFDEELLCGGTGGGSFAMMLTVMTAALVGLLAAFAMPGLRSAIVGLAGLSLLLLVATALLFGVRATQFSGSNFHEEGFAPSMGNNGKFGLDIGYALLLLVTLLAAGLLAYLLKPKPQPQPEPMYQVMTEAQPQDGNKTDVVFSEPSKPHAAAPAPAQAPAPAPTGGPVAYVPVQSPYQNMGMQTYLVPGFNGQA